MKIQFVDIKRQYIKHRDEINNAVKNVLASGEYVLGSELNDFEKDFALFTKAKHAIGVSSGTDGLILSLKAFNIGRNDEVITVANTFAATAFAISHVGATPVFVDCVRDTLLIDVNKIEKKITSNTKAIIIVHLYGQPAEMLEIKKIAKKYNLKLIEDAAQAIGSYYNKQHVGTFGDIGVFSFYAGKNLGAAGEAGMIITNSKSISGKIKSLRNQGQIKKYQHEYIGFNARLDTIQAAILDKLLPHITKWNNMRNSHAEFYNKSLKGLPLTLPNIKHNCYTNWHLYVIRTDKRDSLQKFLLLKGINTGIHYPIPIPHIKAYKFLKYKIGDFPVAEKASKEILSLPMFPYLKETELKYIVDKIKEFYL